MNYKSSVYNHFFLKDNCQFVYNLLSTSIAELDNHTHECLVTNTIENIGTETLSALLECGFVVDSAVDERDMYHYYFDSLRYVEGAGNLQIMFIPTYSCNLCCPYCYEGTNKNNYRISRERTDAVLKFAKNQIVANKELTPIHTISVSLYGGEPMLCKEELIYFCDAISDLAKEFQLATIFDMTSNMTLLDDDIVEMIRKHSISVQVSIDGPKKFHDTTRITFGGKGTYDTILKNLNRLKDAGVNDLITIRINVDKETIHLCADLFDEMLNYSDDVYFGVITSYKGFNDAFGGRCIENQFVASQLTDQINRLYAEKGLDIPQRFGKKGPCSICSSNKFIIDCNLGVYKCEMLINHKKCAVGSISSEGELLLSNAYYKQMTYTPFKFPKCRDCKFLPACAGGCPAKEYIRLGRNDGDISVTDCMWDEETLNIYLRNFVDLS